MGLSFYKPNTKNTGCACQVSFNSKDEAIYFEFIKQVAWNAETKNGSFKNGEKANVKFGLHEVGNIIAIIEQTIVPTYDITSANAPVSSNDIFGESDEGEKSTGTQMNLVSSQKLSEYSTYHDGQKQKVQIKFASYGKPKVAGLALGITKIDAEDATKKTQFSVPFTFGEAIVLREYLKFALGHCFTAIYSADKKKAEEYQKKKLAEKGTPEDNDEELF